MAATNNQWPNPSVNTSYSFAGKPNCEPNASHASHVDSSQSIVDTSICNPTSKAVESPDSLLVNPMSANTDHSDDPNDKQMSSVSGRDKAQPMSSLSSANSGIRFQLTPKQTSSVSKSVNNSFVNKSQTNKESEVRPTVNTNNSKQADSERKNPSKEATPDQWPPSLRDYVNRAFSACVNELDKDRIEIILKGKLTKAHHEGVLFTKDWTKEPLPELASPKNSIAYNNRQSCESAVTNTNRSSRVNEINRRNRKRSRSFSNSPSSKSSDSSDFSDRFIKDRKNKQQKLEK